MFLTLQYLMISSYLLKKNVTKIYSISPAAKSFLLNHAWLCSCKVPGHLQAVWGKFIHGPSTWNINSLRLSNVSKSTIIGSDNGLSPGRRQTIIWTNAGILFIKVLGTNFSVILIEIITFSFKKMCLKVSSAKWQAILPQPQCVKPMMIKESCGDCTCFTHPYC